MQVKMELNLMKGYPSSGIVEKWEKGGSGISKRYDWASRL